MKFWPGSPDRWSPPGVSDPVRRCDPHQNPRRGVANKATHVVIGLDGVRVPGRYAGAAFRRSITARCVVSPYCSTSRSRIAAAQDRTSTVLRRIAPSATTRHASRYRPPVRHCKSPVSTKLESKACALDLGTPTAAATSGTPYSGRCTVNRSSTGPTFCTVCDVATATSLPKSQLKADGRFPAIAPDLSTVSGALRVNHG